MRCLKIECLYSITYKDIPTIIAPKTYALAYLSVTIRIMVFTRALAVAGLCGHKLAPDQDQSDAIRHLCRRGQEPAILSQKKTTGPKGGGFFGQGLNFRLEIEFQAELYSSRRTECENTRSSADPVRARGWRRSIDRAWLTIQSSVQRIAGCIVIDEVE